MGLSGEIALAAAKKYVEESLVGGGAIKGKNCTIKSITEITGGHRVTFEWTLDDGTEQTQSMDVMDGAGSGTPVGAELEKVYTPVTLTIQTDKYINNKTGNISSGGGFSAAEIAVEPGEVYQIVGTYTAYCGLYGLYNSDNQPVTIYPGNVSSPNTTKGVEVTIPNGITTLKVSGATYSSHRLLVYKVTLGNTYKALPVNDLLYGKKWFACGDSFTAGLFTTYTDSQGHTFEESDAFDSVLGLWKTYPYWIGKRTGIQFDDVTCAYAGVDFTSISGADTPFSNSSSSRNYTMIPSDCDYITLQYGLNELGLTAEQIGTKTDSTNETLWGAYNVVLEAILTANPKVKIGIIISDAGMTQTYHDALIDIAEYWGIPYLDLKNGVEVPMMNKGRLDDCSSVAKNLRDSVFCISSNNAHPTPIGHEYRSTVIEAFLRML